MDIHLFGGNQKKQSLIKKLVLKNICDLMLSVLKGHGRGLEGAGREQRMSPLEGKGWLRPALASACPADSHFQWLACLPIWSQRTEHWRQQPLLPGLDPYWINCPSPQWTTSPDGTQVPAISLGSPARASSSSGKALPQRLSARSNLIVGNLFCNC